MPYFASDAADFDYLLDGLTRAINASSNTTHWHALVDLSFDESRVVWPLATSPVHLYAHGRLSNLRSVSPVLCDLPFKDPAELARVVRKLNTYAAGRPMLSFLGTAMSAQDLAEVKQDILEVATADGQMFLLRFADTRVLAALPESLTQAHWARVSAHIDCWHMIDRFGSLTLLDEPDSIEAGDDSASTACIRLGDNELAALLNAGEPDAFLNALDEGFPELLSQRPRASLYTEAIHVCELARRHGIEGSPERFSLLLANRIAGGQLWRDVRLQRWLEGAAWPKDHFSDALGVFLEKLI